MKIVYLRISLYSHRAARVVACLQTTSGGSRHRDRYSWLGTESLQGCRESATQLLGKTQTEHLPLTHAI